jgi:hypothetical protein
LIPYTVVIVIYLFKTSGTTMRQIVQTVLTGKWNLISVNCISSAVNLYSCTFEEGTHIFDLGEMEFICHKYGVSLCSLSGEPETKKYGDDAEDWNIAGEYVNRLAAETIDPFTEALIESNTGKTKFSDQ